MQISRSSLLVLTPFLLVAVAQGQSFNIDVGPNLILWPAPSASYGAAAGQSGLWNAVKDPFAGDLLTDINGAPTLVNVSSNVTSSFSYPFGTLSADDDDFTSDGQAISFFGPAAVWSFTGLVDGQYELYTYCWDPANSGVITDVTITGQPASTQSVGGIWSGSPHVLGTTYSQHTVNVIGGVLSVEAQAPNMGDSGTVLGFQLVAGGTVTNDYCFGDGSGTACPCGNSGGPGEGCANSGGSGASLASTGSLSAGADDLQLVMSGAQGVTAALLFAGTAQVNGGIGFVFGDGLRCAGGSVTRLGVKLTDGAGSGTWGPNLGAAGGWNSGDTRYFQSWYRDVSGSPCGNNFNLTHAKELTFVP